MSAVTSSHLMSVICTSLDISVICGTFKITLRLGWNALCWHFLVMSYQTNFYKNALLANSLQYFSLEKFCDWFRNIRPQISGRGLNRFRWRFALWIHFVQFWIRRFIRGKSGRLVKGTNCVRFLWIWSIGWVSSLYLQSSDNATPYFGWKIATHC